MRIKPFLCLLCLLFLFFRSVQANEDKDSLFLMMGSKFGYYLLATTGCYLIVSKFHGIEVMPDPELFGWMEREDEPGSIIESVCLMAKGGAMANVVSVINKNWERLEKFPVAMERRIFIFYPVVGGGDERWSKLDGILHKYQFDLLEIASFILRHCRKVKVDLCLLYKLIASKLDKKWEADNTLGKLKLSESEVPTVFRLALLLADIISRNPRNLQIGDLLMKLEAVVIEFITSSNEVIGAYFSYGFRVMVGWYKLRSCDDIRSQIQEQVYINKRRSSGLHSKSEKMVTFSIDTVESPQEEEAPKPENTSGWEGWGRESVVSEQSVNIPEIASDATGQISDDFEEKLKLDTATGGVGLHIESSGDHVLSNAPVDWCDAAFQEVPARLVDPATASGDEVSGSESPGGLESVNTQERGGDVSTSFWLNMIFDSHALSDGGRDVSCYEYNVSHGCITLYGNVLLGYRKLDPEEPCLFDCLFLNDMLYSRLSVRLQQYIVAVLLIDQMRSSYNRETVREAYEFITSQRSDDLTQVFRELLEGYQVRRRTGGGFLLRKPD